ncbi:MULTISPECIES: hypothetical protein [Sphingomonas]|uniref:Uncharacterized protein n=1 Tax=Sphingomonas molluscorum TaxID=418184 RepID=A0ABU8Q5G0_9SPHN|nr:hypothetical protein [Sphingomonas sp. JUb134]MBM7405667.1 hypothetical protein [Sphingomonas sp. JUb134]
MIRLAVENSSVEAAWAAFDAAALALHARYSAAERGTADTAQARTARMQAAQEVARLWDRFMELFLAGLEPKLPTDEDPASAFEAHAAWVRRTEQAVG